MDESTVDDQVPATASVSGRRRRSGRWRRAASAATVVIAVGAATAAAVGFGGDDDRTEVAADLPPATAPVTRQTLQDTRSVDGELGYGPVTSLTNRLAGTVTSLPDTGAVVAQGKPLYTVDNAPIALM